MSRKYTLEYIEQYFKDHDCKLLEEEYKNNSTKMRYICSCGNVSKISFASFKRGGRCNKCGTKRGSKKLKHTLEYAKQYFRDYDCELLEEEYINCMALMRYKCSCGNISKISFDCFKRGRRCNKCGTKRAAEKQKFTLEYVKKYFKDEGCILLEKEYINNLTKMRYICNCGDISVISFANFQKGVRCGKCSGCEKLTFKYVKQFFKDNNCELLEKEYINCITLMKYRCSCGNISEISFSSFEQGHRCKKCGTERRSGKNHYNYNPYLTEEDRKKNRMNDPLYFKWRTKVFKNDNYICQKCHKRKNKNNKYKKINAHHIEGYAENSNIRLDKNNGITFCFSCHVKFHSIYGKKSVNRQQLDEFLMKNKLVFAP